MNELLIIVLFILVFVMAAVFAVLFWHLTRKTAELRARLEAALAPPREPVSAPPGETADMNPPPAGVAPVPSLPRRDVSALLNLSVDNGDETPENAAAMEQVAREFKNDKEEKGADSPT
jgi:flagellar basal body-associated protein FliL